MQRVRGENNNGAEREHQADGVDRVVELVLAGGDHLDVGVRQLLQQAGNLHHAGMPLGAARDARFLEMRTRRLLRGDLARRKLLPGARHAAD